MERERSPPVASHRLLGWRPSQFLNFECVAYLWQLKVRGGSPNRQEIVLMLYSGSEDDYMTLRNYCICNMRTHLFSLARELKEK